MRSENKRAHGVTPILNQDYEERTASHQAAFLLPYIQPGMLLLDVGCGPGTITVGLAQKIAPGHVTGIDHDPKNIGEARTLASRKGVTNVTFQTGDALSLPFTENSFDAVFENNVFIHLAKDAVQAAREVYRVLKPHGFFAARDVDANSVIWNPESDLLKELDGLMIAWQQHRGSDITLGKHLPAILREAGFTNTRKSVSADSKGTMESVHSHAEITISLLDGPMGKELIDKGWADRSTLEHLKESIRSWAEHPDAFFANVHVEVIGRKAD